MCRRIVKEWSNSVQWPKRVNLNTIGSERWERPSAKVNALFELMYQFSIKKTKLLAEKLLVLEKRESYTPFFYVWWSYSQTAWELSEDLIWDAFFLPKRNNHSCSLLRSIYILPNSIKLFFLHTEGFCYRIAGFPLRSVTLGLYTTLPWWLSSALVGVKWADSGIGGLVGMEPTLPEWRIVIL